MNLKGKFSGFVKGVLVTSALFVLVWLVTEYLRNSESTANQHEVSYVESYTTNQAPPASLERKITHQETSPDGQREIIRYKLSDDPEFFSNNAYFNSNVIIAVKNLTDPGREYFIFIGEERTGNPHWLGNGYVFFTAHCGSSCQRLTLLNVTTQQNWPAMLGYLFEKNGNWKTYFTDWFGHDFEFKGFIKEMRGEMRNNKPYLVFDMENEKEVEIGEKLFLFTGYSLQSVD